MACRRVFIAQQPSHLARNGFRIREWHQHAALVPQQFGGMPVRRRDDGFARAKGIG